MRRSTIIQLAVGSLVLVLICFGVYPFVFPTETMTFNPNTEITLNTIGAGRQYTFGSGGTMEFVGVTADDRCLKGEFCATAGSAQVQIKLGRDWIKNLYFPATESNKFRDNPNDKNDLVQFGGIASDIYLIKIIDLQPKPTKGITIDPANYQATFLIMPGSISKSWYPTVGDRLRIYPGNITVRFDGITTENKCKKNDSNCDWGSPVLEISYLSSFGIPKKIKLSSSANLSSEEEILNINGKTISISLKDFQPSVEYGKQIPNQKYQAHFEIIYRQ